MADSSGTAQPGRMEATRRPLAAIALLVLAASAGPVAGAAARAEAVDAEVVGLVVAADGTPLPDVEVVVESTDTGTGCFLCFNSDETVAETKTGGDGSYSATLPDTYVAGHETDTDWVVHAILPTRPGQLDEAHSTMEFEVNIKVQEAPPLPVWATDPIVTVDGWVVSIDASSAMPAALAEAVVELEGDDFRGGFARDGTIATFDVRLLEAPAGLDSTLRIGARATADVRVPHANGRTIYHQRTRSATRAIELWAVPPSRGVGCTAALADESAVDVNGAAGCLLTDGDLNTTLRSYRRQQAEITVDDGDEPDDPSESTTTIAEPPLVTQAALQLPAPIDLALVVLTNTAPGAVVEASPDAVTWTPLTPVAAETGQGQPAVLATPPTEMAARYLRVSDPRGVDASEVSAWEARPGMPPTAASPDLLPTGEVPDFGPEYRNLDRTEPVDWWRTGVAGSAMGGVLAGWIALGYILIGGTTDRRRVAASSITTRWVRMIRSRCARVACAIGAWPHVLDLVHRVDDHAPELTPSTEQARFTCGTLRRYGDGDGAGPGPVLVVHSVISSSSVLDLTPDVSLVRALLDAGRDVWLLDWSFRGAPADTGLDALAAEVDVAAWRVRQVTGATNVPIVAYCLGATLALLREASHPSGDPLVLVAPVVDTTADLHSGTGMGMLLAHPWLHPTLALDERGFVPGPLVREAFHWLRPKALRTVRTWRAASASPELTAGYAAMARWVWDHQPLPGGVLFDAVALFRRGGLPARASLGAIQAPILVICAQRDHIVPPASSTALSDLVAGPVEVVEIEAGHVGMLVSLGSGDVLRPALLGWLDRHAAPRSA